MALFRRDKQSLVDAISVIAGKGREAKEWIEATVRGEDIEFEIGEGDFLEFQAQVADIEP